MKKIIGIVCAIFYFANLAPAQGLMGIQRTAAQPFSIKTIKLPGETKREKKRRRASILEEANKKMTRMNLVDADQKTWLKFYADSAAYVLEDSIANAAVDTLNKSTAVKVLATGGISKIEDVKESSGNLAIGLQFRLTKYKRIEGGKFRNWIDPQYLYFMFNARTATSNDTASMQRIFLFPELSKRDFVFGYFWQFLKNDWSIAPLFEASLNKYSDTTNTHLFRSESFIFGVKVARAFEVPGLNIASGFQLFPYYNIINVDPKYWANYEALVGTRNSHATFHNIGLQAMVQVDKVFVFCNMKYVLNKSDGDVNPDFVRFVYTIGGMVSL